MQRRVAFFTLVVVGVILSVSSVRVPARRHHGLRVLACVSDRRMVEPYGWEREARAVLGYDSDKSHCSAPERTWSLPPQSGLHRGGSLSLIALDGGSTCEADRLDPRVLVIGDPTRAHGAIRLPDNAQRVDVEVVDGGGSCLIVVLRSEVWRGSSGVIVATWDTTSASVEVTLDTWELAQGQNYGCALRFADQRTISGPCLSGQSYTIQGVEIDLYMTDL